MGFIRVYSREDFAVFCSGCSKQQWSRLESSHACRENVLWGLCLSAHYDYLYLLLSQHRSDICLLAVLLWCLPLDVHHISLSCILLIPPFNCTPFKTTQKNRFAHLWRLACVCPSQARRVARMAMMWQSCPPLRRTCGPGMHLISILFVYLFSVRYSTAYGWVLRN